jgi:hypothetical protein
MKSIYTGLYVQKDSNGVVHAVQVYDTARKSISLYLETYIERNIMPNWKDLPTKEEYQKAIPCKSCKHFI